MFRRQSPVGQLALALSAFVIAALLAAPLGAASFGIALGVGQLGFAAALVWTLLR